MELEKQVVSLELAKKMKELGIEQKSLWYWVSYITVINGKNTIIDFHLVSWADIEQLEAREPCCLYYYSAYTVAELGEMIIKAKRSFPFFNKDKWIHHYTVVSDFKQLDLDEVNTESDARAKMLIYLKENDLL